VNSWVEVPDGSDFPLENLAMGVGHRGGGPARPHVAIGDHALDLAGISADGLLDKLVGSEFDQASLNAFLALGPSRWRAVRERLTELLDEGSGQVDRLRGHLVAREELTMVLPIEVADYVDFYSSLHHATNLGRMFRPDGEPLLPNWRHLPVGYHGRSGTVVVSGASIPRPCGLRADGDDVVFGPSRLLDIELEVGFVVGAGSERGQSVRVDDADQHVFGVVLLNDWSARDIQAFEYQPLGPFLAKSFATSISPWVVPLEALRPHFTEGPVQKPTPADYLRATRPWAIPLELEVELNATTISRTDFTDMYWTFAQQLAHTTINGASLRTGDLYGSGTVSGTDFTARGSLIELTWRGTEPLMLADGSTRTFLADGDSVTIRGWCGGNGSARIGFGEVQGTIVAAGTKESS
jgi:fumarylacetoacetase